MDVAAKRFRAKVALSVGLRIATVAAVVGLAVLVVTTLASELRFFDALPWAMAWGQLTAAGLFVYAVATNPLSYRYLQRFIDEPYEFVPGSVEGQVHESVSVLCGRRYGLEFATTAHVPDADPDPVFDLCRSGNGLVTAAVGRASGTLTLMSRLSDGRILVSSDYSMPPHSLLLANRPVGDSSNLDALVAGHRAKLVELSGIGIRPVKESASIFAAVMAAEHAAYETLGPILGTFCHLDDKARPHRLLVAVGG